MYNYKEYQKQWRETHKEYRREWFKKHRGKYKERQKNYTLMRKYGISSDEYNNFFMSQNGCCKICNRHQSEFKRRLAVDHDHKTSKVRGLLCHHCNAAIGHFFENPRTMENAITYIKTFN